MEPQASSLYRPSVEDDGGGVGDRGGGGGGFDQSVKELELMNRVDQCETIGDLDDSQLIGAPVAIAPGIGDAAAAGKDCQAVPVEVRLGEKAVVEKRRRGRPPRGQGRATTPVRMKKDEEDVCFICFDGGSLVLCDRRGCPKAYHPACIKRDESFFKSRAKWNCGWHICSTCEKASHYMCYTCTFSLCKGCTKDADYVCVRGNKGLCGTCMRTILLIENFQVNKEAAQVDFDDQTSWEYLFKVYWVLLKGKLSLTLDELVKAKNPWKAPPVAASNWGYSGKIYVGNGDQNSVSANCCANIETVNAKRRKVDKLPKVLGKESSLPVEKSGGDRVGHFHEETSWASKELLEFVSHMRNGDTFVMTRSDVQDLLADYIKRNDLRDPCQKCQIVCDSRLLSMFGRARLGHIEMLNLLESHFLIKNDVPVRSIITARLLDAVGSQMESDWNYDSQMTLVNDKRRKVRKRIDDKGLPTDLEAYAATNAHNINLIYLRRNLLENLVDDAEKFHQKVVGSFVRIKVNTSDSKPEMHRLVRVVGTSKAMEPYKIGTRETDVMLEILNLNKKEVISIDEISNQEFSQDECERLRQCIECGLIKRLTVGEIQEKAMTLQAVKVNDWLEGEILKLNHLRDRPSEKGLRKEHREYVERLELLNSPEERKRRLEEVPMVHADPNTDPSSDNAGEVDEEKQDEKVKPTDSSFFRKRRESLSPGRGGIFGCSRSDSCSETSEISTLLLSSGTNQSVNDFEIDRIWHYQDPTGKVQGPFSMIQLRKWKISGHFPQDLKIWRLNEKQEDSILLTDALSVQYPNLPLNSHLPPQEVKVAPDDRDNVDAGPSKSMNATPVNGETLEESRNLEQDGLSKHPDKNNEAVGNNGLGSHLSSCTAVAVVNSTERHSGIFSEGSDSLKANTIWPTHPQVPLPTTIFPGKQTPSHEMSGDHVTERNSEKGDGNLNVWPTVDCQTRINQACENRSDGDSGQSSGQNWRPPVGSPSNGCHTNSGLNSLAKSLDTSEQNREGTDLPNMPSHTVKPSNGSLEGEAAENRLSASSSAPVQDAGRSRSTASSLVVSSAQLQEVAGDWSGYSTNPAKPCAVEEWDSSLASGSSLKPTEMVGDHAATPASLSDQLTHSSPSHPQSNTSSWHDIEPNEFSSLLDDSVSDLLAEVEAMETLHALSSHTINYGGEVTQGSNTDCLSPVEAFSPAPEPGKGDALSSTAGIHLPPQTNVTDEPLRVGNPDVLDTEKRSTANPSISPEVEGDTKHSDVSVNQWEASADIQPSAPPTTSWDVTMTDTPWTARSESMDTNWGAVQTNADMSWEGGLHQGNSIMDWAQPTAQANMNMNSVPPAPSILGSQPKYGGERFPGSRDRVFHGRDSGFGRNRHAWNRQQFFGSGNSGVPFRPPPKGQRICKFYESGYCKKGAACSYLHP